MAKSEGGCDGLCQGIPINLQFIIGKALRGGSPASRVLVHNENYFNDDDAKYNSCMT